MHSLELIPKAEEATFNSLTVLSPNGFPAYSSFLVTEIAFASLDKLVNIWIAFAHYSLKSFFQFHFKVYYLFSNLISGFKVQYFSGINFAIFSALSTQNPRVGIWQGP